MNPFGEYFRALCHLCRWSFQCPRSQSERIYCRACESRGVAMMADLFDWTPPPGYPDRPGWKEPTTSRDAAEKIAPSAKTLRDQVLAAFRNAWPAGRTADEIAAALGKSILSVRPRLSELRKASEIMPAMGQDAKPIRRKNESGLAAIVWVCRRPEGDV